MPRLPALPDLLKRKIYKTGQTRGADDDQIFQNRVGRNSTCLIPFVVWRDLEFVRNIPYERGYIVLISPEHYFVECQGDIRPYGLQLGENCLVFYETRESWFKHHPDQWSFSEASSREAPLGGHYVARIANTTAEGDERINRGFTGRPKGAGIRQFEYAPTSVIEECRVQLEALFWLCADAEQSLAECGMSAADIGLRKNRIFSYARSHGLLDFDRMEQARLISADRELVCPLCLDPVSAVGMMSRLSQAMGRERHDLTVTEINLFHIEELSYGTLNHRPYNLGWGHHHCNVVCKDSGIHPTLDWMRRVVSRNSVGPGVIA